MNIVVTNVFGPLNRGDHELFSVLLKKIQTLDADIVAIARDPELCSYYFAQVKFYEQLSKSVKGGRIGSACVRICYIVFTLISIWIPLFRCFLPKSQRKAIDALSNADIVIAAPGGYFEDSRLSIYTTMLQTVVAVLYKKRLILAPMSIGPVTHGVSKFLLKWILGHAEKIFVRDLPSKEFCDALNIPSVLANDLAFFEIMKSGRHSTESRQTGKYIAATVVNWNFPKARNRNEAKKDYVAGMVAVLQQLSRRLNLPIKLIVQVESDLPIIKLVKGKLDVRVDIEYGCDTPKKIKRLLKECVCLLASRFHSAIFSLSVGCPVIALSYLPKTEGMLRMYGLEHLSRSIYGFNPSEVVDILMNYVEYPEDFATDLRALKAALRLYGDKFEEYIASIRLSRAKS